MNNYYKHTNRCVNKLSKFGVNHIRDELDTLYYRDDVSDFEKDYITRQLYNKLSKHKRRKLFGFGQTATSLPSVSIPAVTSIAPATTIAPTTSLAPATTLAPSTIAPTTVAPVTVAAPAVTQPAITQAAPSVSTPTIASNTQYSNLASNVQRLENAASALLQAAQGGVSGYGYKKRRRRRYY